MTYEEPREVYKYDEIKEHFNDFMPSALTIT